MNSLRRLFLVAGITAALAGGILWSMYANPDTFSQVRYVNHLPLVAPDMVSSDRYRDSIRVEVPLVNATVQSPLVFSGEARGAWFFEASFPVRLLDGGGNLIASSQAEAQAEWMTEDFVPFRGTVEFIDPGTETGTLVFEKDNPSGLPEHADAYRMHVRFH